MTNRIKKVNQNTKCSVCGRNIQSNNTIGMCSNCQNLIKPTLKFYNRYDVSNDELPRIVKQYRNHLAEVRENRRKNKNERRRR
jgi:threonine synthase